MTAPIQIPGALAAEVAEHPERFRADVRDGAPVFVLAAWDDVEGLVGQTAWAIGTPLAASGGLAVAGKGTGNRGLATAWLPIGYANAPDSPRPKRDDRVLVLDAPVKWVVGKVGEARVFSGDVAVRIDEDTSEDYFYAMAWAILPPAAVEVTSDVARAAEIEAAHFAAELELADALHAYSSFEPANRADVSTPEMWHIGAMRAAVEAIAARIRARAVGETYRSIEAAFVEQSTAIRVTHPDRSDVLIVLARDMALNAEREAPDLEPLTRLLQSAGEPGTAAATNRRLARAAVAGEARGLRLLAHDLEASDLVPEPVVKLIRDRADRAESTTL